MNENSTSKRRDRTNLKRLDSLTDEKIEQAARSDADTLLLEECDIASTPKRGLSIKAGARILPLVCLRHRR